MAIVCNNHPDKEATGMCVSCGKPYCADCLVDVGGKMHCKDCLANSDFDSNNTYNYKSKSLAVVLCLFLGMFGIHRFYVGKIKSGLAYAILTLLLNWTIIIPCIEAIFVIADLVTIIQGKFLDSNLNPLV